MFPDEQPHCCVPERTWERRLNESRVHSAQRYRATRGAKAELAKLDGGEFLMGSDFPGISIADGEAPVRPVYISPFYIAKFAVTNEEFSNFVAATGHVTDAERFESSFVFHLDAPSGAQPLPQTPWWRAVKGASWARPEGPDSSVRLRMDHPVVHISWTDALAFCEWAGYRLPTESEWELLAGPG